MIHMRHLSALSYAALLRLNCPGVAGDSSGTADNFRAAAIWHFVHTAPVDVIERASDEELRSAATAHGYTISPAELPALFAAMTKQLNDMREAFVETERDTGPLASTTAINQISPQA